MPILLRQGRCRRVSGDARASKRVPTAREGVCVGSFESTDAAFCGEDLKVEVSSLAGNQPRRGMPEPMTGIPGDVMRL